MSLCWRGKMELLWKYTGHSIRQQFNIHKREITARQSLSCIAILTKERMIIVNNRKVLAETLREYERIIETNDKEYENSDVITRGIITRIISTVHAQVEAVKNFARQIGIISYKENYDMTTQELIEKIDAE